MKKLLVVIMVMVTMMHCATGVCQTSNYSVDEIYRLLKKYSEENNDIYHHYLDMEVDDFGVYCDWSVLKTDYLLKEFNVDWYNDELDVFKKCWKEYIKEATGLEDDEIAIWVNKVDEYEGIYIFLMGVCSDHDLADFLEGDQCAVELLVGVNK